MESQVSEVERLLEALYGTCALSSRGVVHVVAAVRVEEGLRVMRIGDDAPRSTMDFFVLNLCRARADAILTTAENLRAEPGLHHDLQGKHAEALRRYRREVLGKQGPPVCAILTRSGNLPVEHPAFADETTKVVLSPAEPSRELRRALGDRVRFVRCSKLDARAACAWLHAEGHALVSLEAGPSTACTLYGADSPITELLLSLYEGPLEGVTLGGKLPDHLTDRLTLRAEQARPEESGRWRFQHWGALG